MIYIHIYVLEYTECLSLTCKGYLQSCIYFSKSQVLQNYNKSNLIRKVCTCSCACTQFRVLLPPSLLSLARSDGVQAALGLSVLCHVSSLALTHAGGAGTRASGLRC